MLNAKDAEIAAEADGNAQERYVEIMNAFAVDLISIPDEIQLAWYVAREVVHQLGFNDCVIYYSLQNPTILTQMAAIGPKNLVGNLIVNHLEIPVGSGVTGRAAQTKEPIIIDDLKVCDFYIPDVEESRSEICVPIICHGKVLGVIDSEDPDVNRYNSGHLKTLKLIAALMAAKLELIFKSRDVAAIEDRNRRIYDASLDGIATVNNDGILLDCNRSFAATIGYSKTELVGIDVVKMLLPDRFRSDYERFKSEILEDANSSLLNKRFETTVCSKTGQEIPVEMALTHFKLEDASFVTAFVRDITERKQGERARETALMEAEKANKAKSEFLATMSHELRTPLNAIIGFSEVLYGEYFGALGSSRYKEYAEDIKISGRHLLTLVNDILDLSAIEADEMVMHKKTFEIKEVMHDCSIIVKELATKKGITYTEELPDDPRPFYADPRAISQILINLLSNAIKFTPSGGTVSIKICAKETLHRICISDTGPGMVKSDIENLTKPFVRGQLDAQTTQEGSGLGLAIVKSLVRLHGGTLNFESELGVGTQVYVELPNQECEQTDVAE